MCNDGVEIVLEQSEQVRIADVAGGDKQKPMGRLLEQEGIDEIRILGDDRALFAQRNRAYLAIFGSISVWKVSRVNDIVPSLLRPTREPQWQLRVDKELHDASA